MTTVTVRLIALIAERHDDCLVGRRELGTGEGRVNLLDVLWAVPG
jgi:hypothetical protein